MPTLPPDRPRGLAVRTRRARGRGARKRHRRARGGEHPRERRHGRCLLPAPARPSRPPAGPRPVARPGRGPAVPHPRFRAALRRRGRRRPAPPCASRGLRRPARATARPGGGPRSPRPSGRRLTGQADRRARQSAGAGGASHRPHRAQPGQPGRASRLAGPVRPGAGRDAGRVPAAAAAGAVDNRAGPRPHPAARAPAVGRAAAAGPAGGDLPSHRRRPGDGRGRGVRAAGPRAGRPAGTGPAAQAAASRAAQRRQLAGVRPSRRPRDRQPAEAARAAPGPVQWRRPDQGPRRISRRGGYAGRRGTACTCGPSRRGTGRCGRPCRTRLPPADSVRRSTWPRRPRSARCRTAGRAAAAGSARGSTTPGAPARRADPPRLGRRRPAGPRLACLPRRRGPPLPRRPAAPRRAPPPAAPSAGAPSPARAGRGDAVPDGAARRAGAGHLPEGERSRGQLAGGLLDDRALLDLDLELNR